ncbi:MAG: enoyl-CoA hydratase-related protein [Pseudomonadota bacterium]
MQSTEQLLVSENGAVATLTLNRPDALNALTPLMLESLAETLSAIASRDDISVVIITGAGRAFSAGVDLKSLNGAPIVNGMVGDLLDVPARAAITTIERMPQPVIARLNGHCFTGALELALACDLIYIQTGAKLGDTHAKWGLRPTWGMSQRLPRLVGMQRAKELSMTAMTFGAEDALRWGVAAGIAEDTESLDTLIQSRVDAIVANSREAIAAYKALWHETNDLPLAEGISREAERGFVITDTASRLSEFIK